MNLRKNGSGWAKLELEPINCYESVCIPFQSLTIPSPLLPPLFSQYMFQTKSYFVAAILGVNIAEFLRARNYLPP